MKGLIYLFIGFVGVLLTHPFTLIIGIFLWIPYGIWLVWESKNMKFILKSMPSILLTIFLIFGVTAFYILPLVLEIKYFYYGTGSHFIPGNFLTLKNYLGDQWAYFYKNDIEVRGNIIHLGLVELIIILWGALTLVFSRKNKNNFLYWVLPSGLAIGFLTTRYSDFLYTKINMLGNVQQNWRMFTSMILVAPFVLASLADRVKPKIILLVIVVAIVLLRFPQLYGKNFVLEQQNKYYWTKLNLHGNIMNTIWTGPTQDYPVKKVKGEIIEGKGKIEKRSEYNSWREYEINAETELRLVDYTFYFPGWKVFVDKKETPIEFQDMNYRGVITYRVPQGKHTVLVKFTDTKIRLLANVISLISIGALGLLILFRRKLFCHPTK